MLTEESFHSFCLRGRIGFEVDGSKDEEGRETREVEVALAMGLEAKSCSH